MFLVSRLGNFKILKIFLQFLLLTFIYALLYKYFGKFDSDRDHKGAGVNSVGKIDFFTAFYFSLVTQTTVGYGDIGPKNMVTKIICMSQLLLTVIIMAVGLT